MLRLGLAILSRMLFVPLYIEAIRARPLLLFWAAALAQAAIWIAVPMLFYSAPPGDLAQLLAVGHEFRFDAGVGPPLAYWLAEIAFRIAGLFGVYTLAQICVVATYWCVFALGCAIVGPAHAVMAVLLMVGITLITVPSPDFGPPILSMALWAIALLQYWRALALRQQRSWYMLAAAAALLLLSSSAALILVGVLGVFTAATALRRIAFEAPQPWIAALILVPFLFLHLLWLQGMSASGAADMLTPLLERLREAPSAGENTAAWLRLLGALGFAHAGLFILVVLAAGWPRVRASPAPALIRGGLDPLAARYVKVLALVPMLVTTISAVIAGQTLPIGGAAPLVVLSGLGAVMAAGDSIELYHQRILGFAWTGLLIVPALFVPLLLVALPWTVGTDLRVAQPANAMGEFFAESFERRTGQKLAIVTGDPRSAALIAVAAPSRPSVFFDADPSRSPWITADDIRRQGAVVVWPATETSPGPPSDIKTYFPDLVAEVPRTFDRPVQGRLPPLRIGWGVIRPGTVTPATR
jgi:hypothetical protein